MQFQYKKLWLGWKDKRLFGYLPNRCAVFDFYGLSLCGFQVTYSRYVMDFDIKKWNEAATMPDDDEPAEE